MGPVQIPHHNRHRLLRISFSPSFRLLDPLAHVPSPLLRPPRLLPSLRLPQHSSHLPPSAGLAVTSAAHFFKSLSLYFRWSFYPIALDCSTLVIQLRLYLPPHSLSPSLHFLTSRYHAASCSLSSSTPPCSSGPLYISAAIPASPPLFSPCVVRYCREEVGGLRGWGAEEAYEMN